MTTPTATKTALMIINSENPNHRRCQKSELERSRQNLGWANPLLPYGTHCYAYSRNTDSVADCSDRFAPARRKHDEISPLWPGKSGMRKWRALLGVQESLWQLEDQGQLQLEGITIAGESLVAC